MYDGSYTAVVGDDAIVHKQQHYVSDTGNVHLYFGSTSRWLIKDVFTPKDETALGYMRYNTSPPTPPPSSVICLSAPPPPPLPPLRCPRPAPSARLLSACGPPLRPSARMCAWCAW